MVGAFAPAVQPRCSRPGAAVGDAFAERVPVEGGLELGAVVGADRDLAVRPFSQGSAVLRSHPAGGRPFLGTGRSSITHTAGPISGSIRSQIRRRTGIGSHVDRFTNCRGFCSLPSGNREAIA